METKWDLGRKSLEGLTNASSKINDIFLSVFNKNLFNIYYLHSFTYFQVEEPDNRDISIDPETWVTILANCSKSNMVVIRFARTIWFRVEVQPHLLTWPSIILQTFQGVE